MTKYKFIKDLKLRMDNIDIELKIDFFTPASRSSSGLRYSQVILIDENKDEIKFTVFGADVDKIKKATRVKIKDGYISEWQGQLQLNSVREHPVKFIK